MPITIDQEKCCWRDGQCASCGCGCGSACVGCAEVCPVGAIARGKSVEVDFDKCISCGSCVAACKYGAITLVDS